MNKENSSMATSTVGSVAFLHQLEAERDSAFESAEKLTHRARMLDELLGEYKSGKQLGQKSAQAKTQVTAIRKPVQSVKPKTAAPKKKVTTMASKPKAHVVPDKNRSTMEIVRQVLSNAGQELRVEEIRSGCKEDFGHTPAASLDQMMYKRSKAGSDFYAIKDKDGRNRYGLLAWKANQERAA
jgi:hypothetical protein